MTFQSLWCLHSTVLFSSLAGKQAILCYFFLTLRGKDIARILSLLPQHTPTLDPKQEGIYLSVSLHLPSPVGGRAGELHKGTYIITGCEWELISYPKKASNCFSLGSSFLEFSLLTRTIWFGWECGSVVENFPGMFET